MVVAVFGIVFIALHLNKRYMTSSLIAGLAFAWIFLAAWALRKVFESSIWKPLAFIDIHSFGVYCFHQIVINCVLRVVPHSGAMIWGGSLLLVIFASIMIGYGAEKVQEKMIRYDGTSFGDWPCNRVYYHQPVGVENATSQRRDYFCYLHSCHHLSCLYVS